MGDGSADAMWSASSRADIVLALRHRDDCHASHYAVLGLAILVAEAVHCEWNFAIVVRYRSSSFRSKLLVASTSEVNSRLKDSPVVVPALREHLAISLGAPPSAVFVAMSVVLPVPSTRKIQDFPS